MVLVGVCTGCCAGGFSGVAAGVATVDENVPLPTFDSLENNPGAAALKKDAVETVDEDDVEEELPMLVALDMGGAAGLGAFSDPALSKLSSSSLVLMSR